MTSNLISVYKGYRVYRHLTFTDILTHIICNRIMTNKPLVAIAPTIYSLSSKFPGKTLTNWVLNSTFNKMLTAGNTLEDLEKRSLHLRQNRIPIMIDFCAQGVLQQSDSESLLDKNAQLFLHSANLAVQSRNHMISIKITGLINMGLLKKYNGSVLLRDKLWNEYSQAGRISAANLLQAFQSINRGVTEQDLGEYLKSVHNFNGEDIHNFWLDQIDFKMNHHPYYLYESAKNSLLITKLFYPLDQVERRQMAALKRRLDQILQPHFANKNNYRVLVDAEQSYIQRAIQNISEQIQANYNQQKVYIVPTLQNYLKIAPKRTHFQIQIARRKHLHLALKLVRGAYLVQESRLAQEHGHQTPIVDGFSNTTDNYLNNFTSVINSGLKGQVFAAGHNESTIYSLIQLKKTYPTSIKVNFAQLYGLGDHLTHFLAHNGQNVYKLLPWAQTEVMMRYIIRRAQQLSQMQYPLDTQLCLLKHELRCRLLPP